jgi:NADPH:quinone reductase-like Zn-dependent oxidoreductase
MILWPTITLFGRPRFYSKLKMSYNNGDPIPIRTRRLDIARSLGADRVIDYTREDFTKNGDRYDLILAANGYHSISDYRGALSTNGIYVMSGGSSAQMLHAMQLGPWVAKPNQKDLALVKELIEAGKVHPVVDRCYPLTELAAALRYLGEGHAKGKIAMTVVDNNKTRVLGSA